MLKKAICFFVWLFIFFNNAVWAEVKKIVLCTDNNFWYPFTYLKNDIVQGLHIDIVNQALIMQDYVAEYKPMPWATCQDAARFGAVDGIATISYDPSRETYLFFPEKSDNTAKKSPWRVSQADYFVVTIRENTKYLSHQNPTFRHVPAPIRLLSSYALVNDFQQQDIYVEQFMENQERYDKLVSERSGSVIDLAETAFYYSNKKQYQNQLFIHPKPIDSKSYYLAFSKKGRVSLEDAREIWKSIVQVRTDKSVLPEWLDKY
ncbi:MAG: hypothetical protein RLZ35_811 [Pseudomonadota bacterium]|jgi:polar amino acid transport system substrate-binding protein